MRESTCVAPRSRTMTWKKGFLAVLALDAVLGMGCHSGNEDAPTPPDSGPDQVVRDFQRTESRGGRVTLVLEASRGDLYDRDRRVELVTMRVDFYSREGEHMSRLVADSGHVDTRTENMEAFGNVRVDSDDGAVLNTSRLAWVNEPGEIRTNELVRFQRGADESRGRGFVSDPSLKTFRIMQRVEAEVSGEELRRQDAADTTNGAVRAR